MHHKIKTIPKSLNNSDNRSHLVEGKYYATFPVDKQQESGSYYRKIDRRLINDEGKHSLFIVNVLWSVILFAIFIAEFS